MTITSMIRRAGRALAKPTPKTYVAGGGKAKDLFSERKRTAHQLERYRVIYDQGGVVTEALNSYPLFLSTRGYRLEGPEPETAKVQEWLDETDFEGVMWDAVADALVFGDAFQEIVLNRDGTPSYIVPRLASEFEIEHNEHDKVSRYVQRVIIDGKEKVTKLKPQQILHLQFWRSSGSVYGHSLIHRAYDDIMRDTATAESSSQAIKRHGFKKYHIRVGESGETIPQEVLKSIDKEFQDLESKNDFVTPRDMEIINIDQHGLEQIDTYNDISLMRLAGSLGVPEELLGLRRGSTDATAVKRIDTFFDKISAMQRRVARCYNLNIINRLTSRPGVVKLVFNEVNPDDETKRARWITQVMKATADPFAILPQDWIKKQFTIDISTAKAGKKEEPKEKKEKESGNRTKSMDDSKLIGIRIRDDSL